jgi:NAD(P)H dehydrogenase (quinone)
MAKILVLYYSTYGHTEKMAEAVAEGARSVAGTDVTVKRVPELMPEDVARKASAKLDQTAPIARPEELADYDGVIFGTPTRYGRMTGQMANFLDQTGSLWASGALNGKVGSGFTSTATQHGGQETTLISSLINLLHLGFVVVGLPYAAAGQMRLDEITGGSPYGATTIAGSKGERQPSGNELDLARFQGRHVAQITAKLAGQVESGAMPREMKAKEMTEAQ